MNVSEHFEHIERELKTAITQCLWDFTDKYAAPGSPYYPYVLPTMRKVLTESITEVKRQSGERHNQDNNQDMALLLGFAHGAINVMLPIAFAESSAIYPRLLELHNTMGRAINEMFYQERPEK